MVYGLVMCCIACSHLVLGAFERHLGDLLGQDGWRSGDGKCDASYLPGMGRGEACSRSCTISMIMSIVQVRD